MPDSFFSAEPFAGAGTCFAAKSKDTKNWASLFRMLDYLYSEEGQLLVSAGLSGDQLASAPQKTKDFYEKNGLGDGAYTIEEENGETVYRLNPVVCADNALFDAARPARLDAGYECKTKLVRDHGETLIHSMNEWVAYENTGFIGGILRSQMTAEEMKKYSQVRSEVLLEYMQIEAPKFITGAKSLDADWDSFVSNLERREYTAVNEIFDRILSDE